MRAHFLVLAVTLSAACSASPVSSPPGDAGSDAFVHAGDPSDVPIDGVSRDEVLAFNAGDALFDLPFRASDGLGPVYIREACGDCHDGAARGPGLVQKMSVVLADGVTPDPDQTKLPFGHTVRLSVAGGGTTPIEAPTNDPSIKVTRRIGPPVLGRGYMEAILDSEISRMEADQALRTDGIHGRVNHVVYASEASADLAFSHHVKGETLIGRFGLKARVATLDDFTADAFQGDMAMTTPMRPGELPNPDGLTDDGRAGVDLTLAHVIKVSTYMRYLAIPSRAQVPGADLFATARCNVCHVPSLKTRADYPIKLLAGIDAPVFTDVLLHDMGDALADGQEDQSARSRDWRTAPLMGLRFSRTYLHDGRALTIEEAIQKHGGEAQGSVDLFNALGAGDRTTLLTYVESL